MKTRWCAGVLAVVMVFGMAGVVSAAGYSGKKVLYIDSYHEGYGWSDGIVAGVKSPLWTARGPS